MIANPCAKELMIKMYIAIFKSDTICCLETIGTSLGPCNRADPTFRSSVNAEINLQFNADDIVGADTPRSAASMTVHLPVPFDPQLSEILSSRKPSERPLSGADEDEEWKDALLLSLVRRIFLVISSRKLPIFISPAKFRVIVLG